MDRIVSGQIVDGIVVGRIVNGTLSRRIADGRVVGFRSRALPVPGNARVGPVLGQESVRTVGRGVPANTG